MSINKIEVAASLTIGLVNTPLDSRTRIEKISDIVNIENPFVGMLIYCLADEKTYIVKSLKSKAIGAFTVENAVIDQYEEFWSIEIVRRLSTVEAMLGELATQLDTVTTEVM